MSATVIVLSALLVSYFVLRRALNRRPAYPPGPKPKPIIGNALDIPLKNPWLEYIKMSKKYNSSLIHLSAFATHIVVLDKLEDAIELLDKRSSNYSSRPLSPISDMVGVPDITAMIPYGDSWRKQRKVLERGLHKDSVVRYEYVQAEKVHILLKQLLEDPAKFKEHCRWFGTSVTMAMGFAYDVYPGKKDTNVELAEFAVNEGTKLMLPGQTMIAIFGFLRHIPPWVPGASTQKLGARIKAAAIHYKNEPFGTVKRNTVAGTAKDCILKDMLEANAKGDGTFSDEDEIKNAIAGLYLAGVETMQITQIVFLMAMTLYPIPQKKAQEEIDIVVGSTRLPTLADRPSLPYVEALYREVLRWIPAGPLGFAHSTLEDDEYKGYYIPKGTIIMPNVWSFTRNEAVYLDPESFKPERFLNPDGTLNDDNLSFTFGFGRRICAGKHMADMVVWRMVVSVLATLNISKARDRFGEEIAVNVATSTDSYACQPLPFKCSILPRSTQAEILIRSVSATARQSPSKP